MLNIMLNFLEAKINLLKNPNDIKFIENDKKCILDYINYEYSVNYFHDLVRKSNINHNL